MTAAAVDKGECSLCQFVGGVRLYRIVAEEHARPPGGVNQAKGVKTGHFIGEGRGYGDVSAADDIRKARAEVVAPVIGVFKIIGQGKVVAGFGRNQAVKEFGGK